MSLLLSDTALAARAREASGPHGALAALAASLAADLSDAIRHEPAIPTVKALLSRDGGRCPRHGVALDFDPFRPNEHRCPIDGAVWRGERHDRWWVMWCQLWLAERTVHAAALAALGVDRSLAAFATATLEAYADVYLGYPNRDNVLGPSRPFFSTYLESIWLLQLCIALDLLETAGLAGRAGATVRDRLIAPSMALIASYDEGASNRQVWNNAALIAAGALLDARPAIQRAIHGPSGLIAHLTSDLLADGTWYEGENYHFFAHRGLWYAVTMTEHMGAAIPDSLSDRFDDAFATPLLTALPDFTFPSRRDSQYGVSLRQWRFAESCELGFARRSDARLVGALWTLYEGGDVPRRDTGRWRSTAEAERNEPATALGRADLGWRSLLFARATLPALQPCPSRSVLLSGQGIAVLRRDAACTYLALDYGHSGGGHGHPDRLNVLLCHGDDRWLDDLGTGSYVDPSLPWYRSTLAHTAPMIDGRSQCLTDGVLRAYDERGGVGWVDAEVPSGGIASGVRVRRSLVAMPDYAVDRVAWSSDHVVRFELPLHIDGELADGLRFERGVLNGGVAADDGFGFVHDAEVVVLPAGAVTVIRRAGRTAAWITAPDGAELWRMVAPGAPGESERRFHLVRARGTGGHLTIVWSWAAPIARVMADDDTTIVQLGDGETHTHRAGASTWQVGFLTPHGARSSVDLDGRRTSPPNETDGIGAPSAAAPAEPDRLPVAPEPPLFITLGRDAYRMSEDSWEDAGCTSATVSLRAVDDDLVVELEVRKSPLVFRAAGAPDPGLDNERADIHSDGVQLYVDAPGWSEPAGWLAIPVPGGTRVRVHAVGGSHRDVPVLATWHPRDWGYSMRFRVPLATLRADGSCSLGVQVVINDMSPERTRRRGQLVMTGAAGEYVYLRGDRESPARFRRLKLPRG